ncbi:MAG: putative 2-aminoethylphosphonate ABC transporter permease subunit [Holophagaceae bacterium]|nr:putative 2-aminoethylphosphonate ABC transporter permease subunit [Holophagaceae bacterium]
MKKVKSNNNIQIVCLIISSLLLMTLVVLPLIILFVKAFEGSDGSFIGLANFIQYFTTPNLTNSLFNTIFVSITTAIISVSLAFLYAYAITRTGVKCKKLFKFTSMLPLFAPTMMLGIGLIYLFGNQGIFTHLGLRLPLYGPLGIIISEVIYTFPQVFLVLLVSFSFADNRLYEVAEVIGTSPIKTFFTITLPSVKYGLISSIFIAFSLSFTDFGAPKVVGGNYNVLATDIYKRVVGQQDFIMGAVVGMILMLPAILSFTVDRFTQSKNQSTISSKSEDYKIKPNKCRDLVFTAYCAVINLLILMLLGTVVYASFIKLWPYDKSLTLAHYFMDSPATGGISSFFNSLLIASLTATIGTAFVFINAYLIEKTRKATLLKQTAYFLSIIPLALPGLAIGISFIFFFNADSNPLKFIYGSMWILLIANIVHFYSVPFVTATSSLKKLDKEFEIVSEAMKVPFYKTFYKVTIPMCLPAILEIAVYLFVNAMVTISAVIFLYPAQFKLAAIAIVNMEDAGDIAPAAAISVLIILTNVIVRVLYELINKKIMNKNLRSHV